MHKDVIMNRICYDRMKVRVRIILFFLIKSIGINITLLTIARSETNSWYEAPITEEKID